MTTALITAALMARPAAFTIWMEKVHRRITKEADAIRHSKQAALGLPIR